MGSLKALSLHHNVVMHVRPDPHGSVDGFDEVVRGFGGYPVNSLHGQIPSPISLAEHQEIIHDDLGDGVPLCGSSVFEEDTWEESRIQVGEREWILIHVYGHVPLAFLSMEIQHMLVAFDLDSV